MRTGLDLLPSRARLLDRLRSSRVGLLAHPASVDGQLEHIGVILERLGVEPRIYFGPEHGYGGEAQDMVGVENARHPRSGAPIVSLYGDTFDSLSPSPAHLDLIDVLLVDLADVGSRYYTFVWTALLALRAAARRGVAVVLLDRPNPLGAASDRIEGGLNRQISFVGLEPVPVRHGLTVGEIVALFAARDGLTLGDGGALQIVPVEAPDALDHAERGTLFVQTSPNMPTLDTALVYPGACLIEGTNLSEGRGTTRPFELIGAPFLDGHRLAAELNSSGLAGFVARPVTFHPMFQKHAGKVCGGVQIHVTDRATFRPYATYLALVGFAHHAAADAFRFRTERYEFIDDVPAYDLLTGDGRARVGIQQGADPVALARELALPPPGWDDTRDEARAAVLRSAVGV
jgi:uncharacterized protein YbbC (DUF1343 family)